MTERARARKELAALRPQGPPRETRARVPYGYRLAPDGFHLVPDPGEQAVLARVRELAAAGLSQAAIAADLAARGVVGRSGAPLLGPQVARLLARAA